jgi:hypothetical protein
MKLKLRGFSKETLKKYDNVKENPLLAISPKNQKTLKVISGDILIDEESVQLIDGKSDEYVGMTKTLRDSLGLDIGQDIEIENSDGGLKVRS